MKLMDAVTTDWSQCALVERVPGKVSGVPILKGTRMPADAVIQNYSSGSAIQEIAENFEIPEASVRALVTYATGQHPALKP